MDERFEPELYKVFVRADEQGRVVAINSNAFVQNASGWVEALLS